MTPINDTTSTNNTKDNTMTTKFHGVIPPVVTPLTPNGDLDVASYEKLINRLIDEDDLRRRRHGSGRGEDDERDEYVLTLHGEGEMNASSGVISARRSDGRSPASTAALRTADSRAERSSGFTRASLRKGRRARARANEPCEMAPSGPRWGPSRRVRRGGGQAGQAARPPARDRTRPPELGSAPTTASRARADRAPAAQ